MASLDLDYERHREPKIPSVHMVVEVDDILVDRLDPSPSPMVKIPL